MKLILSLLFLFSHLLTAEDFLQDYKLIKAIDNYDFLGVQTALKNGANPNCIVNRTSLNAIRNILRSNDPVRVKEALRIFDLIFENGLDFEKIRTLSPMSFSFPMHVEILRNYPQLIKYISNMDVYFAAYSGNLDVIKYLIENKNIDRQLFDETNLLQAAAKSKNYELVQFLKESGFNWDWETDEELVVAFKTYCRHHPPGFIKMLIDEHSEILDQYILDGIRIADKNMNFELLDFFNDIQALEPWHLKVTQIRAKSDQEIEFLAKYNIFKKIEDTSLQNNNPLFKSKDSIDEYLQSGRDINKVDQSGYNYLSRMIGIRNKELAVYLHSKGAQLQPLDSNRESTLLFSIESKNNRILEEALNSKAPHIFKYGGHAIFTSLKYGTIESLKKLYPIHKGLLTNEYLRNNIQYIRYDLKEKIQFLIQEGTSIDGKIVITDMPLESLEIISQFVKEFPLAYLINTLIENQHLKAAQIWDKCNFNLSEGQRQKLILKCLQNESIRSLRLIKSKGIDLSFIREDSKKYLLPELWALTGVSSKDYILTKEKIERLYWSQFLFLTNENFKVPNHLKIPYTVKLCTSNFILPKTLRSAVKQLALSQEEIIEVLKLLSGKKKIIQCKALIDQLQNRQDEHELSKLFLLNGFLDYTLILTPEPFAEFWKLEEEGLKNLIKKDDYITFSKVLPRSDLSEEAQKNLITECLDKDNIKFLKLIIQNIKNPQLIATALNLAFSKKSLDSANILIDRLPANFELNLINPITLATREGHISLVEKLIERGRNIFEFTNYEPSYSSDLYTPPHIAVHRGYLNLVKMFVKHKILAGNVKTKNQISEGITPLKVAVKEEYSEIVKFLIDNQANYTRLRADILETGNESLSTLINIQNLKENEINSLLLGQNNDLIFDYFSANPGMIHKISILNLENPKLEKFLLKHFPNQNKKTQLSLLREIIDGVDLEVFKGFFNLVTLTPKELDHLLLVATLDNNLEVCQFLLKNKADPFRKFLFGVTTLTKAINENRFQVVKLITDHFPGVKINFTKSQIETLINYHPLIFSYFIEKGKISIQDEHMMEAIQNENAFLVNLLLEKVTVSKNMLSEAQTSFPLVLPLLKKNIKE